MIHRKCYEQHRLVVLRLFRGGSPTFLILIGFVFTVIENYIDSKTITCHSSGQLPKYAQ